MNYDQVISSLHLLVGLVGIIAAVVSAYVSLTLKASLARLELKIFKDDRDREDRMKSWVESYFARKAAAVFLVLLLLPCVLRATQIVDTLKDATGKGATGILYLSWPSFVTAADEAIQGGTLALPITNGLLNVTLAATSGGTLAAPGASAPPLYTIRFVYTSSGSTTSFTESWNVIVSATPLTLNQIVCGPSTCGGSLDAAGKIPVADLDPAGSSDDLPCVGRIDDSTVGWIPCGVGSGGNVSAGGTLTSGNVVVGAGSTDVADSTKAAPTGAFVGTTDTQTLTNKSIASTEITGLGALAAAGYTSAGLVKSSGTAFSAAALSDVLAVWTSCSSGYLKFDGTCSTPSGGGGSPPAGTLAARPITCTPGDIYTATDQPAGQQQNQCDSANHWTVTLSLGPSGALAFTGGALDADPAILPFLASANIFPGLNKFTGGIALPTSAGQPTCSSSTRDYLWTVQGNGSTTSDSVQVCGLLSSGAYVWQPMTGELLAGNNLSDLVSASTARTNLGLGSAATHPATDFQNQNTTGNAATATVALNVTDIVGWCNSAIGTANATTYVLWPAARSVTAGDPCTATGANEMVAAHACTFKNLYVSAGVGGGNSGSGVTTLYISNAATVVTCTLGTSSSCNDTTHSVAISAGGTYSLRIGTAQASDTIMYPRAAIQCQ